MIVMSFNIREWTRDKDESAPTFWKKRLEAMQKCILNINPDILCVQECWPRIARKIKKLGYKSAGISFHHIIFVKKGIKTKNPHFNIFVNWCDLSNGIRIVNVHTRWERKLLKYTVDKVNKITHNKKSIACGDFNASIEKLTELGIKLNHVRTNLGLEKIDTFQNFTKQESHGEIDHFFVNFITPNTFKILKSNYGCEGRMSDHHPIVMTIDNE